MTHFYDFLTSFSSVEQLRMYLDSKQNLINTSQKITTLAVNNKALELFEFNSEEEMIGNNHLIFVWDPLKGLKEKMLEVYAGKTNLTGIQQIKTSTQRMIIVYYALEVVHYQSSTRLIYLLHEFTNDNIVDEDVYELNQRYTNYLREFRHLVKNNLQLLISLVDLMKG